MSVLMSAFQCKMGPKLTFVFWSLIVAFVPRCAVALTDAPTPISASVSLTQSPPVSVISATNSGEDPQADHTTTSTTTTFFKVTQFISMSPNVASRSSSLNRQPQTTTLVGSAPSVGVEPSTAYTTPSSDSGIFITSSMPVSRPRYTTTMTPMTASRPSLLINLATYAYISNFYSLEDTVAKSLLSLLRDGFALYLQGTEGPSTSISVSVLKTSEFAFDESTPSKPEYISANDSILICANISYFKIVPEIEQTARKYYTDEFLERIVATLHSLGTDILTDANISDAVGPVRIGNLSVTISKSEALEDGGDKQATVLRVALWMTFGLALLLLLIAIIIRSHRSRKMKRNRQNQILVASVEGFGQVFSALERLPLPATSSRDRETGQYSIDPSSIAAKQPDFAEGLLSAIKRTCVGETSNEGDVTTLSTPKRRVSFELPDPCGESTKEIIKPFAVPHTSFLQSRTYDEITSQGKHRATIRITLRTSSVRPFSAREQRLSNVRNVSLTFPRRAATRFLSVMVVPEEGGRQHPGHSRLGGHGRRHSISCEPTASNIVSTSQRLSPTSPLPWDWETLHPQHSSPLQRRSNGFDRRQHEKFKFDAWLAGAATPPGTVDTTPAYLVDYAGHERRRSVQLDD